MPGRSSNNERAHCRASRGVEREGECEPPGRRRSRQTITSASLTCAAASRRSSSDRSATSSSGMTFTRMRPSRSISPARFSRAMIQSSISYPAVAFFRSQHQRQSWVSALATILDLSALVEVGLEGVPTWQAHVTFAMARHAAVDLTQVLHADPETAADRLSDGDFGGAASPNRECRPHTRELPRGRPPAVGPASFVRALRQRAGACAHDADSAVVAPSRRQGQLAGESPRGRSPPVILAASGCGSDVRLRFAGTVATM